MRTTAINDFTSHDIYADNLILGKSMLLTLNLPGSWNLAPGVSRPEVAANHTRQKKTWVASGKAWYVVFDGERNWALELAISIRHEINKTPQPPFETAIVGGHTAQLTWRKKRRGLPWNRHDVTFMTVDYDCPQTERHLRLEFSGWCPESGFWEILEALRIIRCHQVFPNPNQSQVR